MVLFKQELIMLSKRKLPGYENLYTVFDGNKRIGRYNSKEKAFFYVTNEIFRKYDGFGINVELLNNPEFDLEKVIVLLINEKVNKAYMTSIKKFYDAFEKGEDIFEDKRKTFKRVYVRLHLWIEIGNSQLSFDFMFEL